MRVPTLGRRLYSTLMFLLVSVLGGILAAGLFVPTAGMAAEAAKTAALALNSLPKTLEVEPIAEGSKVLMADGTVLATFFDQNRKYVKLADISKNMLMAQVGIEDQRFYDHGALDLRGTLRAAIRSASGTSQGGSTLTQQYVKLALLYDAQARKDTAAMDAANNRTLSRKVLELRYAVALEKQVSKDDILERYLNLAYYGDGTYGVEAASQHYFGVTAKDLSLPQAAMLAGLVRNPNITDPVQHQKLAEERMRNVLDRLVEINTEVPGTGITRAQADEAKQFTFDQKGVKDTPSRGCLDSPYPHLCSYVYDVLLQDTSLGKKKDDRVDTLNRAGLTIQTYIDPRFQDAAQTAISNVVAPTDPVDAMMNMIEPGTGIIKAMAQSKTQIGKDTSKGETYLNFAASNDMDGPGGFQGGSTFKAFTITAAVLAGYDPENYRIDAPQTMDFQGATFQGCSGPTKQYKPWQVSTSTAGNYNMYEGATYSSNTFFVQLEQQVGICNVVRTAEALGLKRADGGGLVSGLLANGKPVGGIPNGDDKTFTLGTAYATPLSLANAYATLAARGMRCDPIVLKSITDADNRSYAVPDANCKQVIPQAAADRVNDILHGPFSSAGTAASAQIPGYQLSGKTGTQTQAETILTNGYTPDLVGSVLITADKKNPITIAHRVRTRNSTSVTYTYPVQGLTVHGNSYTRGYTLSGSSGREAGAMIWKPAMVKALALVGKKTTFVPPADGPAVDPSQNPNMAMVPTCDGLALLECKAAVEAAGFNTKTTQVYSNSTVGRFLGPLQTGYAPKGSTISLQVSKGPKPLATPVPTPTNVGPGGAPGQGGGAPPRNP